MDPVIRALDHFFARFAVWWIALAPTTQIALTAGTAVVLGYLILAWRDWVLKQAILWVLNQQLSVQASAEYKDLQEQHARLVEEQTRWSNQFRQEQEARLRALETQTATALVEIQDDILQGRFPVHLLAKSPEDVEKLAAVVAASRTPKVESIVQARVRAPSVDPTAPNAYAHLLDEEEECPTTPAPPARKNRRRAPSPPEKSLPNPGSPWATVATAPTSRPAPVRS